MMSEFQSMKFENVFYVIITQWLRPRLRVVGGFFFFQKLRYLFSEYGYRPPKTEIFKYAFQGGEFFKTEIHCLRVDQSIQELIHALLSSVFDESIMWLRRLELFTDILRYLQCTVCPKRAGAANLLLERDNKLDLLQLSHRRFVWTTITDTVKIVLQNSSKWNLATTFGGFREKSLSAREIKQYCKIGKPSYRHKLFNCDNG